MKNRMIGLALGLLLAGCGDGSVAEKDRQTDSDPIGVIAGLVSPDDALAQEVGAGKIEFTRIVCDAVSQPGSLTVPCFAPTRKFIVTLLRSHDTNITMEAESKQFHITGGNELREFTRGYLMVPGDRVMAPQASPYSPGSWIMVQGFYLP